MKITRVQLLALALGACLLIAVPLRANDEYEEVPDDEEDADTDEPSEDDVVVMTDSNFDDLIKKHKFALVEFYAPWCGHCKKLAPEYAAAATALKQHDASILIGKVDATEQTELGAKFSIQGYPTLKWFVEGEATDYEGGRTTEAIVGWVKKKTGPPAETVDSADRIAELEKENEVVVVGYFSKLEGEDFDIFQKVAQKVDDVAFVQTTNADVAKTAQITTAPGVGVIKNFKTETSRVITVLNEKLEKPLLEAFIKAEKIPLIIPFNKETQPKIFGSGIDKHILIIAPSSLLEAKGEVLKAVKAAAEEHKGTLMFVTAALDEEDGKAVAGFFDVPEDSTEAAIVGFFMEKRKKYKMDGKVTEEAVKAFAAGVADGTAPATYKSEEIPAEPEDGGVTVVVGKNFDAIVKDPTKDVLLEIYAPWCGHCKSLAPTYKKLAKRFQPVDSVVIAKMDGTANEHEDADAQGFPTILFFPAEEGASSIPYEGDRSLLDMTKFIKKNAKIPYELQKKPKKGAAEDSPKEEL